MSYDELGRIAVASLPKESAENLSEYLTLSGIETILIKSEGDAYIIMVDRCNKEAAEKLISEHFNINKKRLVSSAKHSQIRKFNMEINSAIVFFVCGLFILIFTILKMTGIIAVKDGNVIAEIIEIVLGAFFLIFGAVTLIRIHKEQQKIIKQNEQTLRIIEWFLSTYTPNDLDAFLDADIKKSDAPSDQRRSIIAKIILREYSIEDEEYLTYLTEEVFSSIYLVRKFKV